MSGSSYQTGVMAGILAPEANGIDVELYATCNYMLDTYLNGFRGSKEAYIAGFIMGYKGWACVP